MNRFFVIGQRGVDAVDSLLDRLTSYRLVLYSLLAFLVWAVLAALLGEVAFEWYQIIGSALCLTVVCVAVNMAASRLLRIPRNKESDIISALILALILLPAQELNDYLILAVAGTVAMLSKYILVFGRRHIFNPAALGAFAAGRLFDYFPAWWVGTKFLTPLVFIAGLLIMRKMKRYLMVSAFMVVYLAYIVFNFYDIGLSGSLGSVLWLGLVATPVMFFAYIMLTEPSTSPHKLYQMLGYAVIVAIFYSVTKLHIAPEEALLIGNLFAFVIAPRRRLVLTLQSKKLEAKEMYSYIFSADHPLAYAPGQYMEWTLPEAKADSRGNRRYFTLSSSPTEDTLMFTVRQPQQRSSFKTGLDKLPPGGKMLAYELEGSFVLPDDTNRKLFFIAGGIGVTPFRSIVKYLQDSGLKRDIVLLHSASVPAGFAFKDLFKQASRIGLKIHYIISGEPPGGWTGFTGTIDRKIIKAAAPDYKERVFYISGPYSMVVAVKNNLLRMGVSRQQIKTDYFPGYG